MGRGYSTEEAPPFHTGVERKSQEAGVCARETRLEGEGRLDAGNANASSLIGKTLPPAPRRSAVPMARLWIMSVPTNT